MSTPKKTPRSRPSPDSSFVGFPTLEVQAGVFKNTCLSLMDKVRDERMHIVITKHGSAVAMLVPVDGQTASARGFMRGTVLGHGDIVSPDFETWGDT